MRIRLLRGQVVIREVERRSSVIWTPAPGQRQIRTHRGIVLAMGAPALHHGHEVSPGFRVGDEVTFHWEHNEEAFTREWPEDGKPACWVRQFAVDGVWIGPLRAEDPIVKVTSEDGGQTLDVAITLGATHSAILRATVPHADLRAAGFKLGDEN